ncbi:hypothetical protein HNP24_001891 [Chryseobacterium sediminis]|uniref:Uncharacterized protein n=1 Tax=Chryseobacterium sediminis TaxID=1679494 RepID=A0ABR6PYZ6_9FLAO|nr:hypothetical protein [Chryseobacterium sediminis]MBB6330941.1 hypothetical protein [Chryseobacterium sediminis]
MEDNKLTTRDQLKTYFETGKSPTQNQFSDLIDSLRHKEDGLTNKEIVYLANRLAAIDNGFISYANYSAEDEHFPIVISSQDEEDEVIDAGKGNNFGATRYFAGTGPYTISTKKFSADNLKGTEYYVLRYEADPAYSFNNTMARTFGNTLPPIPDGFNFGPLKGKRFYFEVNKRDYGRTINIVNTNIKFVNKTEAFIEYMIYGGGGILWGHEYTSGDVVTDHYDIEDYLNFFYRADLRKINKPIECRVYDGDTDQLLATSYLAANQNNINIPSNGTADRARNVRIECDYQDLITEAK